MSRRTGITIEEGSTNVYADLGYADAARFNTLALTADGARAWRKGLACITRHSDGMLQALDAAERAELTRLLRKMLAANLREGDIDFG